MNSTAISIRRAAPHDVRSVVTVHAAAFPEFFLTRLGPAFLRAYYRAVLEFDAGWLLVADRDGRTIGFVAGFADPDRFYAGLKRRSWRFAAPLALGLLQRPWLIAPIVTRVAAVVRRGRQPAPARPGVANCELSSLAVHPAARQQGIGGRLVAAFVEAARAHAAAGIRLTTDARDNDAVNAFYARSGFRLVRHLAADGARPMNEYEFPLRAAG